MKTIDRQIDGYDRITEVLNYFAVPDYVRWVGKVGNREAKRAGTVAMNIGTNVDEWIKAEVTGEKLPKLKTDEARNCVEGYKLWVREYAPKLKVGQRIFDSLTMLTGEPDIYTEDTAIDIKCSLVTRLTYWLQTEWYARQLKLPYKAVLRLDKHLGTYEYTYRAATDEDSEALWGLVKAYRWFNLKKSVTDGERDEDVNDTISTDTEAGSAESLA